MNHLIIFILCQLLFQSCEHSIEKFWVNGQKVNCEAVSNTICLQINHTADQSTPWENFHGDIEGFTFQEGIQQYIKVKKATRQQLLADASAYQYELIEVMETKAQPSVLLNDIWTLETLYGKGFDLFNGQRLSLEFQLSDDRVSGNAGCNQFFGSIQQLSDQHLQFNKIGVKRMACIQETGETEFLEMLGKVNSYTIEQLQLRLFDADGEEIAVFKKVD